MLVIGHRGASRAERENSPAAFRVAAEMGADAVELDVRRAPDGSLLVHHDPVPQDPAGQVGIFGFAEVLEACGDLLINVEIKNLEWDPDHDPTLGVVDAVMEVLADHVDADQVLISSFSRPTLDRCVELDAAVRTALLVVSVEDLDLEELAACGHVALHPHVDLVDARLVGRCHELGLAVNAWTCNDPVRLRELASIGADGVCTDVPDEALRALGRTGPLSPRRWGTPA